MDRNFSVPRSSLLILKICFAAAFVLAFVFVVILELKPDGQGLAAIFLDPFVLFGLIFYGTIAALFAFPIAWYCLKGRRLLTCSMFVIAIVLLEVVLVTPRGGWMGFFGAFPALVGALLVCKFSKRGLFAAPTEV